jgi:hypothetical protein
MTQTIKKIWSSEEKIERTEQTENPNPISGDRDIEVCVSFDYIVSNCKTIKDLIDLNRQIAYFQKVATTHPYEMRFNILF